MRGRTMLRTSPKKKIYGRLGITGLKTVDLGKTFPDSQVQKENEGRGKSLKLDHWDAEIPERPLEGERCPNAQRQFALKRYKSCKKKKRWIRE